MAEPSRDDRYLTLAEIAVRWRMAESTARRKAIAGKIPGAFKQGGHWLFSLRRLQAFETYQIDRDNPPNDPPLDPPER